MGVGTRLPKDSLEIVPGLEISGIGGNPVAIVTAVVTVGGELTKSKSDLGLIGLGTTSGGLVTCDLLHIAVGINSMDWILGVLVPIVVVSVKTAVDLARCLAG